MAAPLSAAGLRSLADIAAFTRTGLAAMVPDLARYAHLEALEGALRRAGLFWATSSYIRQDNGAATTTTSATSVTAFAAPATSSTSQPTSSTAALDDWTAAFQRAWSAAWASHGGLPPPAHLNARTRPRLSALVARLEGVVEPAEAEAMLTTVWRSYLSAHATGQPWPARSRQPAFPRDNSRPAWGHGLWAIGQLTEADLAHLAAGLSTEPEPSAAEDLWSTWGQELETYDPGPPVYAGIHHPTETCDALEPAPPARPPGTAR